MEDELEPVPDCVWATRRAAGLRLKLADMPTDQLLPGAPAAGPKIDEPRSRSASKSRLTPLRNCFDTDALNRSAAAALVNVEIVCERANDVPFASGKEKLSAIDERVRVAVEARLVVA